MALSRLFICMLFCLALVRVNAQDNSDDEKPTYDFDTTLKGGCSLYYTTDDTMQYLYLRKGNKLKLISSDDIGAHQSMLCIISGDFDDYFVLTHTLHLVHQQDPIMCDLFEKKTMRLVMKSYY